MRKAFLGRSLSTALVYVTLALPLAAPAAAEDEVGTGCDESSLWTGTFHRFSGGGACYLGSPDSVHGDWQNGYCHQYHYTCQ